MGTLTTLLTCCYATLVVVIGAPFVPGHLKLPSDMLQQCNVLSVNELFAQQLNPLPQLDLQRQEDARDIDSDFDYGIFDSIANILTMKLRDFTPDFNGFPKTGVSVSSNLESVLTRMLLQFGRLRNNCIMEFLNQGSPASSLSAMLDDVSRSEAGQRSLNERNLVEPEGSKRAAGLALNPTGWRRKRETPKSPEELRRFLDQMRQLLRKRDRLPVHTTGW